MTRLSTLKPYKIYRFESSPYRTEEYAEFERKYRSWMRRVCKNNGWELVKAMPTHFEIGFFIRGANGKMVNILGADVRFRYYGKSWWDVMCYRYCKDENDYHGENNCWCTLDQLEEQLQRKLN